MKKIAAVLFGVALLVPTLASAHERDNFKIGNSYYQFVVGSLNEPLVVDDKSGLDLTVSKCFTASCTPKKSADGDMDGPAGTPVKGLESTLKVTMMAGDMMQSFDISPVWGKDGAYKTTFYPTVATTFSYHITGTLENTPIDLTFTCLPEGAARAADDTTPKNISEGVTRTLHAGAFGCPLEKEKFGFPEKALSTGSLARQAADANKFGILGVVLGIVGAALAGIALGRKKS